MIKEVKKYVNEEDKSVTAYMPLPQSEEQVGQDMTHYEGTVGIRTPMGVQPLSFPFPSGYDLAKCFEDFEKVADVEVKKIMEEAEKKQKEENLIITPGQANNQNGGIVQFPGS